MTPAQLRPAMPNVRFSSLSSGQGQGPASREAAYHFHGPSGDKDSWSQRADHAQSSGPGASGQAQGDPFQDLFPRRIVPTKSDALEEQDSSKQTKDNAQSRSRLEELAKGFTGGATVVDARDALSKLILLLISIAQLMCTGGTSRYAASYIRHVLENIKGTDFYTNVAREEESMLNNIVEDLPEQVRGPVVDFMAKAPAYNLGSGQVEGLTSILRTYAYSPGSHVNTAVRALMASVASMEREYANRAAAIRRSRSAGSRQTYR